MTGVAVVWALTMAPAVSAHAQPASTSTNLPKSLTGEPSDAERGRALAWARDRGNCVACHVIPAPDMVTHGSIGPPLKGLADRQSEGQIRARIVDARAFNAAALMPSYHRTEGLKRVAKPLEGRPVLSAQEVEDMVAFMLTLREGKP